MNTSESAVNLIRIPNTGHPVADGRFPSRPKRLLDVSEVAKWLGVSKGWVRDHASGRRQPRLDSIKLGATKGKGLWKFREEDVQQFLLNNAADRTSATAQFLGQRILVKFYGRLDEWRRTQSAANPSPP
jgi:predicted DNA-binding transcriptional regulator AlpA